jgi:putative SOS response-associated peptidase YedK
MINARSETVAEKPAFRSSFAKRRCLVPADGFYEWQKLAAGRKQPHHIRLKDRRPFAIAGLWSRWQKGDEEPILSFTLLTTTPNELTAEVHDRMPVILPPTAYESWLTAETPRETLEGLLLPYPAADMETCPVSTLVNNPRNDVPQCLDPA